MTDDQNNPIATRRLLRLKHVKERTGMGRSTIYTRIREGAFPRAISLGGASVAWIESEVEEWISARIEDSRTDAGSG